MRSCLAQLKLQDNILATPASDHERWTEVTGKAYKLRMEHVAGVNEVEGQVKFLELEISRGRMGPGDLAKVFEKAKELGARGYMLASFAVSSSLLRNSGGHMADTERCSRKNGARARRSKARHQGVTPHRDSTSTVSWRRKIA
jgi:hypothetical protein